MAITKAIIKSSLYLDITATDYDTEIDLLIDDVVARVIDYLDNYDYDAVGDFNTILERVTCQQITYEWRRRKDPGLTSVQLQDGSINKFELTEWLPEVKAVLDRYRSYTFSGATD